MERIPRFLDAVGPFADGLVDVVGAAVAYAGGQLRAVFGAEDEFGGVAGALLWSFVSGGRKGGLDVKKKKIQRIKNW